MFWRFLRFMPSLITHSIDKKGLGFHSSPFTYPETDQLIGLQSLFISRAFSQVCPQGFNIPIDKEQCAQIEEET